MAMMELLLKEGKRNQQLYEKIIGNRDERIKSLKAEIDVLEGEKRRQKTIIVHLEKDNQGLQSKNAAMKEKVRSFKARIAAMKGELVAWEDFAEQTASRLQKSPDDGASKLVEAVSDMTLFVVSEIENHKQADSTFQTEASETGGENPGSLLGGYEVSTLGGTIMRRQSQVSEAASIIEANSQSDQIIQKLSNPSYRHFLLLAETMWRGCNQLNQALMTCSMLVRHLCNISSAFGRCAYHLVLLWLLDIPNFCIDCSYLVLEQHLLRRLPPAIKAFLAITLAVVVCLGTTYFACWSLISLLSVVTFRAGKLFINACGLMLDLFISVPHFTPEWRFRKGIIIALPVHNISYKDLTQISTFFNRALDNPLTGFKNSSVLSAVSNLRSWQRFFIILSFAILVTCKTLALLYRNMPTLSIIEELQRWTNSAAKFLDNHKRYSVTQRKRIVNPLTEQFGRLGHYVKHSIFLKNKKRVKVSSNAGSDHGAGESAWELAEAAQPISPNPSEAFGSTQ